MTQIISVYSPKGGVGKTVAVTHIADCLATKYGKRVIVYDSDPQLSLYDSVVNNKASYKFNVVDRLPDSKPDCDIFIIDYRPAAPFGDKGLLKSELDTLKNSNLIIVPTRVARMDIRSVAAVQDLAFDVPMLKVLNAIDLQKNQNHAEYVAKHGKGYLGMAYRNVYSHTVDDYSTIYTATDKTLEGQRAAKLEIEAVVEHALKALDSNHIIPSKYLSVMPKLITRAIAASKRFAKVAAEKSETEQAKKPNQ